jgi:hypothetical protein
MSDRGGEISQAQLTAATSSNRQGMHVCMMSYVCRHVSGCMDRRGHVVGGLVVGLFLCGERSRRIGLLSPAVGLLT